MADDGKGRGRKRRRPVAEESDTPFSADAISIRGAGPVRAFRLALYGILPGAGLLLGPIAFLIGFVSWLRAPRGVEFKGESLCKASMLLGATTSLTQWLGVWLMIQGLSE